MSLASATPLDRALREIRPALIAVGGLSLFINLLVFVSPIYTMQIYDRVMSSRNATTLVMLTGIVFALFLAYAALEHLRSRALVQAGLRFDRVVAEPAFETALASALRARGPHHVQLLRNVDTLRDLLSGPVVVTLMDAPWVPIYLATCFALHVWIGLVALFGAGAIVGIALLNERATKASLVQASLRSLQALDHLTSSLRNAEAIRGLGMTAAVRSAWTATHGQALGHSVTAAERGGTLLALSRFLRLAIQSGIMGVGAYLALQQEVSAGVLFAASLIMGRALAPVEALTAQWRSLVTARTAHAQMQRVFRALPAEPRRTRLPRPTGAVSVEALTLFAPGAKVATLRDINLSLRAGEIAAVVGPTGSGKSSLARALVGAWSPAHGCVRLDGNDVRHHDADQLGQALGYLPQDVELFTGTVRDNIARFRADAADEAVIEAASQASAHAMIQLLEEGYDTFVGEDGMRLSGGQRQRVGLARALFGRPALVVLDEPNANLDADGDAALSAAIARLREAGSTVVIVTHRPNLLSLVDTIVCMHDGRVRRVGSREEFLPLMLGPNVTPAARPRAGEAAPPPGRAPARPASAGRAH